MFIILVVYREAIKIIEKNYDTINTGTDNTGKRALGRQPRCRSRENDIINTRTHTEREIDLRYESFVPSGAAFKPFKRQREKRDLKTRIVNILSAHKQVSSGRARERDFCFFF